MSRPRWKIIVEFVWFLVVLLTGANDLNTGISGHDVWEIAIGLVLLSWGAIELPKRWHEL